MSSIVTDKLHKFLASRGFGSRREMERWIEQGRVVVDGSVAKLGLRVTGNEIIEVNGKRISKQDSTYSRILVLNKKAGLIVSRKDKERQTVFDQLPPLRSGRWIAIGRLDIATTGLLLFTNDGDFAHRLMHPSAGIDREYAVRVDGLLDEKQLENLRSGVGLDQPFESFSDIQYYNGTGRNHWYHVCLMEGRNREVRRLFASEHVTVNRLKRVRYGPIVMPSWLRRGQVAEMSAQDVFNLYRWVGLDYLPPDFNEPPAGIRKKTEKSFLIPYPGLQVDSNN